MFGIHARGAAGVPLLTVARCARGQFLRWVSLPDAASSYYEVLDGVLFEQRFNALRYACPLLPSLSKREREMLWSD